MNTIDAIYNRRSIRKFKQENISTDSLGFPDKEPKPGPWNDISEVMEWMI